MPTSFRLFAGAVALTLSAASWADDPAARTMHSKGEPAETLQQAVANLEKYNDKLAALLDKGELTAMDMHEVHMTTYTLENALERLQAEVAAAAEALEEVHVASETSKPEVVLERGRVYLDTTAPLVE